MKRLIYILLIILTFLFSCINEKRERTFCDNLIGIYWENCVLDFIKFDSSLVFISKKDWYSIARSFNYSIVSDTLIIKNKTIDTYNIIDLEDFVSYLKIEFIQRDSIKLKPLNKGAKELFNGFESFNFYNSSTIDRYFYYKEKDTACLQQIEWAKEEIKNGIFVLCIHPLWPFRQETEFIKLLEETGIKYKDLGPPPDEVPVERNCYKETMDYYIRKQFGRGFIDSLMRVADTLMVRSNRSKFFEDYVCDERPHLYNLKRIDSENITIEVDLPIRKLRKEWKTNKGEDMFAVYSPFMDIGFHIDTTGVISDFHLNLFNPELAWNKKYEDKLFSLGVEKIKEKSSWVSGKILDIPVRTNNNVRVHFRSKNE